MVDPIAEDQYTDALTNMEQQVAEGCTELHGQCPLGTVGAIHGGTVVQAEIPVGRGFALVSAHLRLFAARRRPPVDGPRVVTSRVVSKIKKLVANARPVAIRSLTRLPGRPLDRQPFGDPG